MGEMVLGELVLLLMEQDLFEEILDIFGDFSKDLRDIDGRMSFYMSGENQIV